MAMLDALLDHIEDETDLSWRADVERRHVAAMNFEACTPPLTMACPPRDPRFKTYPYTQAFEDPRAMMVNELLLDFSGVLTSVEVADDFAWAIRANYGVGVVASVLGARCRIVGNNMPWVEPVEGVEEIKRIVARGLPDVRTALVARVIETNQFYREKLAAYPKLSRAIHITQPDLEGPMDIAHLVWGKDVLLAMYDEPKLVAEFFSLVAETYIACLEAIAPTVVEEAGRSDMVYLHWGIVKGRALIKDDSAIMLSPEHYERFVKPCDRRILDAVGGGGIHSCGDFGHLMPSYLSIDALKCIDAGQSDMLDMDRWYPVLCERKTPMLRVAATAETIRSGQLIRRFPTGVTFFCQVRDPAEAVALVRAYREHPAA
jgi:hypothetical protein